MLESIRILGDHAGLFLGLSKLYASSFNLKSITLEDVEETDDDKFQQLFSCSPRANLTHRLRYLALINVSVRFDEGTLSHLTNLTSFKYSCLESLPDSGIWIAFRRSQIYLEELEVGYDAMGESLNDYLSSFSGLKKLGLSIPAFASQASSEASAVKFWSDSFPNHVDTLESFNLHAVYDGQWCFGHHNNSVIAKCTKLTQLTIGVLPGDTPIQDSDGVVSHSIFICH
jgi:hypothetical protein